MLSVDSKILEVHPLADLEVDLLISAATRRYANLPFSSWTFNRY